MKSLMFVIILFLACIAAVGFYRGWFHVSTGRKATSPSHCHGGQRQNPQR